MAIQVKPVPKTVDKIRVWLRDLSDSLRDEVGPEKGFALFIETESGWSYTSNLARSNAVEALTEWLDKTAKGISKSPGRKVTSRQLDARLALERRCAEVATPLQKFRMALFLWDTDDSNGAWVSNVETFRERVAAWVKNQKAVS